MTTILALDLATVTGFARGDVARPMPTPIAGSIRFGKTGASDNAVFAHCMSWISELLEPQPRPDFIAIEAMLPPGAMVGATTREVRDRLAGLHGIVRAVAHLRGIDRIEAYRVGDVRAHFIGERGLKRDAAKRAVMYRCAQLGWQAPDDNAGDALALWSHAAAQIDPNHALMLSPLFNASLRRSPEHVGRNHLHRTTSMATSAKLSFGAAVRVRRIV
ncbi:MAG TPA: hypothetical protein VGH47_04230 [Xanthobacteraceae bacterium]|jgi:hypothetical protein